MTDTAPLPRDAYCARDWQEKERVQLFANSWVFAGTLFELENSGDFLTVQAGAYPLMVVRGANGDLAGFHNICRHRGATLCDGKSGNVGQALICPYHRWTYDLAGGFRGAPKLARCFPGMERDAMSLKAAAVGVFRDLVFVNADPDADFEAWIAPIADRAWPHDLKAADLRESAPLLYQLKCDWKLFIENAIDGYHLAYLHENTLGGPVADENIWERAGDHMIWYATDGEPNTRYRLPGMVRAKAEKAPLVQGAEGPGYGGVYFLFPNTLIVPTPFGFSVSTLTANGPGQCSIDVRLWVGPGQSLDDRRYIPGYDSETGIISSDNWTKHALESGDFQTEDVWICEKVQQGVESPSFEFGPLAEGAGAEEPIAWFRRSVAERMAE